MDLDELARAGRRLKGSAQTINLGADIFLADASGRQRGTPTSTDCAAAEGERSRPTHKWGSLVLGPAVSMVPIGPEVHHDHSTGDSCLLASGRLPSVLALEIPLPWRPAADRRGSARTDPADERGKSAVGCTSHPWRAAQARLRGRSVQRREVHGQAMWTAVPGVAHLPA